MTIRSLYAPVSVPHTAISGAMSAFSYATLDALEEHIALIFQVPKTGILKKVAISTGLTASLVGTLTVSLEAVGLTDYTVPVATSNATKTLYAAGAEGTLSNPEADTQYWVAINGSTGIAVTKGDRIAVTVRITSYSSGSIRVHGYYTQIDFTSMNMPLAYVYTGSGAFQSGVMVLGLEYDGEMVPFLGSTGCGILYATVWNSSDTPLIEGTKFSFPYPCRLVGTNFQLDCDVDVDVHVYDADGFSHICGTPYTLDKDVKQSTSGRSYSILFPQSVTLLPNKWYRIALEPKDTTDIRIARIVYTDDGSLLGIDAAPGQKYFIRTTIDAAPSAESHAWTDINTERNVLYPIIDGYDDGYRNTRWRHR